MAAARQTESAFSISLGEPSCSVAFAEERVVLDAVASERRLDLARAGSRPPGSPPSPTSSVRRAVDPGRQVGDVLALIAAVGHLLPARPRLDRLPQQPDLVAGVVEVVLARDRVTVVLGGSAPARRRTPHAARSPRPAVRSGWPRRTRPVPAPTVEAPPAPNRSLGIQHGAQRTVGASRPTATGSGSRGPRPPSGRARRPGSPSAHPRAARRSPAAALP